MARYVPKHRRRSYRKDQRRQLGAVAFAAASVLGLSGTYGFTPGLQAQTLPAVEQRNADGASQRVRREPRYVQIDAIEKTSTLIPLGLHADGTLEVPTVASQASWFKDGVLPGEKGPAIILGHIDSHFGPAVFARLSELLPGDRVRVAMSDGEILTFAVKRVDQYPKDMFPTDLVYGPTENAELRLITCGGNFDESARSYTDNVVVYAALV